MSKKYLYMQIADDIRSMINGGQLQYGDRILTEHELSEKYGVSRITSQKAIQQLVDEGVLIRKKGSGTFLSKQFDKNVAGNNNRNIIPFILPYNNSLGQLMDCIEAITAYLSGYGYHVTIHNSEWNTFKERELIRTYSNNGCRGMILFPISDVINLDIICELSAKRFPLVIIDKSFGELPLVSVRTDNAGGTRAAIQYMIDKAHRNIAFVSFEPLYFSTSLKDRYYGYCQTLLANNIPLRQEFIHVDFGNKSDGQLADLNDASYCDRIFHQIDLNLYRRDLTSVIKKMLDSGVTAIFTVFLRNP